MAAVLLGKKVILKPSIWNPLREFEQFLGDSHRQLSGQAPNLFGEDSHLSVCNLASCAC
jgi:hypothetical protein